jgi:hypothetical protein
MLSRVEVLLHREHTQLRGGGTSRSPAWPHAVSCPASGDPHLHA